MQNSNTFQMRLNREITTGNLVSWALILIAFVAGYARLRGNVETAIKDANDAKITAVAATAQINQSQIALARIETKVTSIEKSVDEIKDTLKHK